MPCVYVSFLNSLARLALLLVGKNLLMKVLKKSSQVSGDKSANLPRWRVSNCCSTRSSSWYVVNSTTLMKEHLRALITLLVLSKNSWGPLLEDSLRKMTASTSLKTPRTLRPYPKDEVAWEQVELSPCWVVLHSCLDWLRSRPNLQWPSELPSIQLPYLLRYHLA